MRLFMCVDNLDLIYMDHITYDLSGYVLNLKIHKAAKFQCPQMRNCCLQSLNYLFHEALHELRIITK